MREREIQRNVGRGKIEGWCKKEIEREREMERGDVKEERYLGGN